MLENKFLNCQIAPSVKIVGECNLKNCIIEENVEISSSTLENCKIEKNCKIGPYAHIHSNSKISENCVIGNFVEIKNSLIERNTKIKHLSYVGDAIIGKNCNIGCGVVFANFNGKEKFKTIVKDGCFIGSNSTIIAPLTIEKNCFVCAGTTLTQNTKPFDFVIGRARETIKPKMAKKYLKSIN